MQSDMERITANILRIDHRFNKDESEAKNGKEDILRFRQKNWHELYAD